MSVNQYCFQNGGLSVCTRGHSDIAWFLQISYMDYFQQTLAQVKIFLLLMIDNQDGSCLSVDFCVHSDFVTRFDLNFIYA